MKKLTLSLFILTLVFNVNITSAQTDGPYMYTFVDSKEGKGSYTLVENEENIFMEVILKSSKNNPHNLDIQDLTISCTEDLIWDTSVEIENQTFQGQHINSGKHKFNINQEFPINESIEFKFSGTALDIKDTTLTICDIDSISFTPDHGAQYQWESGFRGVVRPVELTRDYTGIVNTLSINPKSPYPYPYYIEYLYNSEETFTTDRPPFKTPLLYNFRVIDDQVKLNETYVGCAGATPVESVILNINGEKYEMNLDKSFLNQKYTSPQYISAFSFDFDGLQLPNNPNLVAQNNYVSMIVEPSSVLFSDDSVWCSFTKINYDSLFLENPTAESDSVRITRAKEYADSKLTDLDFFDPSYTYQSYLINLGIIKGYPDKTFRADNPINRAELAAIINRTFIDNSMSYEAPYNQNCFSDLEENSWYIADVCRLNAQTWLTGDDLSKTFRPADNINMVEALKVVLKAIEQDQSLTEGPQWYSKYLTRGNELNIISSTYFNNPGKDITRGELAELIYKAIYQ